MTDIPGWVLDGLLRACREVVEQRGASPLLGIFGDEQAYFTLDERDAVWRHLSKNGICCARVRKIDKRPGAISTDFIIVARDDAALAAELDEMRNLIEQNKLADLVRMEFTHDA